MSVFPFSLLEAEKENVPKSLGVWKVSLEQTGGFLSSSEVRTSFCLSVQLPSFRVFLIPLAPSSFCLSAAWGVCLCPWGE